jgi:PRTRC genetic system ThiF family protein
MTTVNFSPLVKVHVRLQTASPSMAATTVEQQASRAPKILVVGCGGTGGWVVPHLARLLKSLGVGSLALADGDVVEPKNLTRQNFVQADLGENKAVVLAKRYSGAFGVPIRAIPGMLEDVRGLVRQQPQILVGCVDGHATRRAMAEYFACAFECAWIDSGNESVAGQVICGYNAARMRDGFLASSEVVSVAMPAISQLLDLPVGPEARPSCADMRELTEQVSTVNIQAACIIANFCRLILEDVKRTLLRQSVKGLDHHGIYFNVRTGSFRTLFNTVENLQLAKKPICPWRQ